MWPDIEKVSIIEDLPAELGKLPKTLERFDASRFFGGHTPSSWKIVEVDIEWRRKVMSWLCWASIAAFSSIRDTLWFELSAIGLENAWHNSNERSRALKDPLIAVVLELRNYQVHFEFQDVDIKDFSTLVGYARQPEKEPERFELGEHAFISKIDFTQLAKTRNIQQGISSVTKNHVAWFNRQAATWPSAYLIGEARHRFAGFMAEFIRREMP
jgi:hypothetical protein